MATRLKFTRPLVDALEPPKKGRDEYADSACPGLTLRVTAAGAKSYCLFKRLPGGGRLVRLTLGKHPEITPDTARGLAFEALASMAKGTNPAANRKAQREELTLGQAFKDFCGYSETRKRTIEGDKRRWELHFAKWNSRRLSELSKADVLAWHQRRCKAGHPTDANRCHALLRKVINHAILHGWPGVNPAAGVPHAPEISRERFLTKQEMPLFLWALRSLSESQRTFRDLVLMALMTAQRRGNLVAMRWDALDLSDASWTLSGSETKNKRAHVVPLIPPAIELLRLRRALLPKNCPWVFPSDMDYAKHYCDPKKAWAGLLERTRLIALSDAVADANEIDRDAARAEAIDYLNGQRSLAWGRKRKDTTTPTLSAAIATYEQQAQKLDIATKGLGCDNLRFHDLRRSAASWMAMGGTSLTIVGKALGHASPQATAVYARLDTDSQRAALAGAFGQMLGA